MPVLTGRTPLTLQAVDDALLRQVFEPFGVVLHAAVLHDSTTSA